MGKSVHRDSINWEAFKYVVFDAPMYQGTYNERYMYLQSKTTPTIQWKPTDVLIEEVLGRTQCSYLEVACKEECSDMGHIEQFFKDVVYQGGEGIVLRPAEPAPGLKAATTASY